MKKTHVFTAVGLVAAGLATFLLMKPSPPADASRGSSDQAVARRADEVSIPRSGSSAINQQASDWASKPSDELYRNFHTTKSRAEAGDAAAQRRLAGDLRTMRHVQCLAKKFREHAGLIFED